MANKVKVKVFIGVLALTAAGVGTVSFPAADASTAACGSWCTSLSVESVGTGGFLTVTGTNTVGLAASGTTNSGQDFTPEDEGEVGDFTSDGILSTKLNLMHLTDEVVEYQYAPDGVPSDECLADGDTTVSYSTGDEYLSNTNVTLAQCGLSGQTLWIVDGNNFTSNGYTDLINAGITAGDLYNAYSVDTPGGSDDSTTPFAEPYVLTVTGSTVSGSKLTLAPLSEIGGVVSAGQLWTGWSAPAQAGLRRAVANSRTEHQNGA